MIILYLSMTKVCCSVSRTKSYFLLMRLKSASLLIFNVPQQTTNIWKQGENKHLKPFWDPFKYICLFIQFQKIFCDKYSIITYFGSFPYLLFYFFYFSPQTVWMRIQKRHTHVLPRTSFKSLWSLTHFGSVY